MNTQYHIAVIPMLVKQNCIDKFIETFDCNAKCSRKEDGVVRFEAMQSAQAKNEFLIIEVYKTADDQLKHRETSHYKIFKENVSELLKEPYSPAIYNYVV